MVLSSGAQGDFSRVNPVKKLRAACYAIEGINSFAAVIYFNYLYFFFRDKFGFHDKQNLLLAALLGLVYVFAAWQAGRFAHRCGYFTALKTGFGLMIAGLAAGSQLNSVGGQVLAACVVNAGVCCIWPTLEALISESETPDRVPHAVGIYNITWAVTNAAAFFIGGTLIEKFSYQSMFYVPLALVLVQLALVFWIEKIPARKPATETANISPPPEPDLPSPEKMKSFRRMAWLANPFAYIAINTLLAVLPGIAAKFHLSPMIAGFTCSLWCFVRVTAFVLLWQWTAWHYRFRWLAAAFALLIVSFTAILVMPSLAAILVAQIFFGAAIGLIYYSSLFYSMDASDTKSEHGGIHEAVIGLGNCVGPAVGAASLQFQPQYAHSGAVAVSALLLCGFGGLVGIWKSSR